MYTDEWLRVDDVWLHYQDWPARDAARAETVLLLHGLTQQSHAFDAVAARLARRHRCLALDLRGRGESGWVPGTYAIPRYVLDVLALLDRLGLPAVHLLGTSLGGLIGLSLAGAAPRGWRRTRRPSRRGSRTSPAPWPGRPSNTPGSRGGRPRPSSTQIRWAVRREPGGRWRLKFDPEIGRTPRPPPEVARVAGQAWWAALEALRCPVLLVRGGESDILSAETAAAMQARQPRLSRVDVPGVGHAPTLTEPAVVDALDAFYLAERPPRAGAE